MTTPKPRDNSGDFEDAAELIAEACWRDRRARYARDVAAETSDAFVLQLAKEHESEAEALRLAARRDHPTE